MFFVALEAVLEILPAGKQYRASISTEI